MLTNIKYYHNAIMQKIPKLLTLKQTCDILKVHPNTMRKWDREGILKAVRFGKRGDRRYKEDDVKNLIKYRVRY